MDNDSRLSALEAPFSDGAQVRILILNDGQNFNSTLFQLEKGWILEFQLGPSLFGKEICLKTNHPSSEGDEFKRNDYHELVFKQCNDGDDDQGYKDETGLRAKLHIAKSGSFHYYFTDKSNSEILGSGYFNVDPVLKFSNNNDDVLPLNSIQCQTVLAKCLGPFHEWEGRLQVTKQSGYNMIHFTPLQELGDSNSSYCIKDQLKLNPNFSSGSNTPSFDDIYHLIDKLRREWKVLSISDVVLNHTANESPWLLKHPECSYNMTTAPHLIPSAILDGSLAAFGADVGDGKFSDRGIPDKVTTEEDLQAIKSYMKTELIPSLKIDEFYACDPNNLGDEFRILAGRRKPSGEESNPDELKLIHGSFRGRKQARVDMELALKLFNKDSLNVEEEVRISNCVENFKNQLHKLNAEAAAMVNDHLNVAIDNCIATIRYQRLQSDGPKMMEISRETPLIPRYFTGEFSNQESVEKEVLERGDYIMAHNGWVMNCDPLKNFADKDSNVYLRRELVAWGDSVKLRYGDRIEDCPYVWNHMRTYVEETARIFHGIRLDNCHSTPFAVAEYMLDCARRVRPDLYIAAELFTNSDEADNIFVNRLGITSLIREAMSASNPRELGRLVHRFGGDSIGSFHFPCGGPLKPSIAHALFYDVTHDNPSPIERKSVFDCLPSSAIVNMACCASGSTRGFDELVPHHIHVVNEERLYSSWSEKNDIIRPGVVTIDTGFISIKKRINKLHKSLNDEGYSQVYVDQMNENIVAVSRHNPITHDTIIMVAHSAFYYPDDGIEENPHTNSLKLEGEIDEILMEAFIEYTGEGGRFSKPENFTKDVKYINGLLEYKVRMRENIGVEDSKMLKSIPSDDKAFSIYELVAFPPGSIIIFKMFPLAATKPKLDSVYELSNSLISGKCTQIINIAEKLNLEDLNYALYRVSEEDAELQQSAYHVPGYGTLVYCGLQGFTSVLSDIRQNNDLGHPFCNNLRQGDWMLDYIVSRLKRVEGTRELGEWFEKAFENLRKIPRYLIPRYFDLIVSSVTYLLQSSAAFQMSAFVRNGSTFVRHLAMGSVQCVGRVKSARLPPSSGCTNPEVTVSAGLPHFSVGFMRSWGRDTFISLRGLLLLTGRYEVARAHILGYAACLRHGLIPNLLGNGESARFNCRDAVWWWLHSIISYVKFVPNGSDILDCPVSRLFPSDDSPPVGDGTACQPLYEVMQEALTRHFQGVEYRERNAGTSIDEHMTDLGFNNRIGVDLNTGFVYGGNEHNCGTWMDKMGSSVAAGNRGRPATPRDGSAVELVGLSKSVLRDLHELHKNGVYPYDSVERTNEDGKRTIWKLKEWEERIAINFEKYFWIDPEPKEGEDNLLIHRRGIYKDTSGASQPWADYQLRCNFPIALVVAPEMIEPSRGQTAIEQAEKLLLAPLGMKTLDPADWNYCGDYNNDNDSSDPKIAHGFNYHQGPEWIWPVAFFLRAKLHFAKLRGDNELKKALHEVRRYLGKFYDHVTRSHWRGLPELTNRNGAYCKSGCHVQAWSMACVLEVLYDIHQLEIS